MVAYEREHLTQAFLHDFALHIRQAEIAALVAVGQPKVIDAEEVEDGRVEVIDVDGFLDRVVAELVGRAVDVPLLDARPGHPDREAVGVMVAAVLAAGSLLGCVEAQDEQALGGTRLTSGSTTNSADYGAQAGAASTAATRRLNREELTSLLAALDKFNQAGGVSPAVPATSPDASGQPAEGQTGEALPPPTEPSRPPAP
mgnify:CR=1 FL=1